MIQRNALERIIVVLQNATSSMAKPAALEITRLFGRDPFLILISTVLSLRTKDTVSLPASLRLFKLATVPEKMILVDLFLLEKVIYPVGFFRQKSFQIHRICQLLLDKYDGAVPSNKEELLALPGVGLKTANLVLSEGFQIPALCVDIHLHRISNRLGLVTTKTPEETEQELQKIIPQKYWIQCNELFVMWGQNQCVPLSPFCSTCPFKKSCPKIGVKKSR